MNLLTLLKAYHPTAEENEAKEKMIAFIEKHPNCFERTLEVGHITGSAWLMSRDRKSVLLSHHAKLNCWVQLGGHCDGDPDVLQTALREAREESGIQGIEPISHEIFDIDIHQIPARGMEKAHLHYDARFLLQVVSDEEFVITPESKELRWFSKIEDLPTQSRSVLRMFEKSKLYPFLVSPKDAARASNGD